jgi:hypothetical protein
MPAFREVVTRFCHPAHELRMFWENSGMYPPEVKPLVRDVLNTEDGQG